MNRRNNPSLVTWGLLAVGGAAAALWYLNRSKKELTDEKSEGEAGAAATGESAPAAQAGMFQSAPTEMPEPPSTPATEATEAAAPSSGETFVPSTETTKPPPPVTKAAPALAPRQQLQKKLLSQPLSRSVAPRLPGKAFAPPTRKPAVKPVVKVKTMAPPRKMAAMPAAPARPRFVASTPSIMPKK